MVPVSGKAILADISTTTLSVKAFQRHIPNHNPSAIDSSVQWYINTNHEKIREYNFKGCVKITWNIN